MNSGYLGKEHPQKEETVQRPCGQSVRPGGCWQLPLHPSPPRSLLLVTSPLPRLLLVTSTLRPPSSGPEEARVRWVCPVFRAEIILP